MQITWLGQGGFIVETEGLRLLIDPYLSDIVEQKEGLTRLIQPPLTMEELKPDAFVCTHNHMDHFDPIAGPEILKAYPTCPLVGPDSVRTKAVDCGADESRFTLLDEQTPWSMGKVTIVGTPADHSDKQAIGLLIKAEGKAVYISGDTLYSDTLGEQVKAAAGTDIDIALICINGRLGNMNLEEAVEVMKVIRPGKAIPMHYGLFAENTADPKPFVAACKAEGIDSIELVAGTPTAL